MNKREALRLQKQAGLDRVLSDVRESIARIRVAARPRSAYARLSPDVRLRLERAHRHIGIPTLSEETRFAARQLAGDAERYADDLQKLPAHLVEAWTAAGNLAAAIESVEAQIAATDPSLVEAQRLLGAVAAAVAAAKQAAEQRVAAEQYGGQGGRPQNAERDAALVASFDARQRANRTRKLKSELYEDVADEFGVKWWTVRDAVLKATPAG